MCHSSTVLVVSCNHDVCIMCTSFVPLDPTLTHENVSKVTATLGEDKLANVLDVPLSKQKEFRQQSSTTVEYRKKVIDYFLKYSHLASWSDVSSRLYRWEHHEALAAVREFIKGTSGKSSQGRRNRSGWSGFGRTNICEKRGRGKLCTNAIVCVSMRKRRRTHPRVN